MKLISTVPLFWNPHNIKMFRSYFLPLLVQRAPSSGDHLTSHRPLSHHMPSSQQAAFSQPLYRCCGYQAVTVLQTVMSPDLRHPDCMSFSIFLLHGFLLLMKSNLGHAQDAPITDFWNLQNNSGLQLSEGKNSIKGNISILHQRRRWNLHWSTSVGWLHTPDKMLMY